MNLDEIPVFKNKPYTKAPELTEKVDKSRSIVVVGSGPIGLTVALDLARKGHQITLVTAFDFIPAGSKGICYSKQSLDILDRLGIGQKLVDKGVIWNIGKVFWGELKEPIYQFDMLPVKNQKNPGFINIQQYYVEQELVNALEKLDNVDIRWGHTVKDINVHVNSATLNITTRDGDYELEADYVLACDGNRSHIRSCMGLDFKGRAFEDNFLIADVKIKQKHLNERHFWFDPPFNRGRTALRHRQPDNVWRLDFQLGWDIDRDEATNSENVAHYIKGMLGEDVEYEEEWISIYTFQCRRMERFVHGPVIFVGDSAHLVSPFGARGANSGMSDAENIAWKLDMVLKKEAPQALLESYNYERVMGADENILNSTRSTDFMVAKDEISRIFRDAVLELANDYDFARPYVNSGRLSTPTPYHESPLSTPDQDNWVNGPAPGHPCIDAPISEGNNENWLLESLGGNFMLLHFGDKVPSTPIKTIKLSCDGIAADRYGANDGASYLVRPDQVVAARWKNATSGAIEASLERALAKT